MSYTSIVGRFYSHSKRVICLVTDLLRLGDIRGAEYVPSEGGVLLLCNHQSYLDPVLAGAPIPRECSFMARDSLFRHRCFAKLITMCNAYPVKRGVADMGAIKETIRRLRSGGAVFVFPEATRTPDGKIQSLQRGMISVALRARVPIVPVVLEGFFEIWPRNRKLPRLGRYWIQYGSPLTVEEMNHQDIDIITVEIHRRMLQMQHELRKRAGRRPFQYN